MSLSPYKAKRDFGTTNEPSHGNDAPAAIFAIHEHAATSHHFDFRLAIDGVLKSWVVPKGPSTNPEEKRLAILTEDHPLAYKDFEGNIPKGEYGAGTVLVWDYGTYRNLRDVSMHQAFNDGQIEVALKGEKLTGGYALLHAKLGGDEQNWLLIKMDDAAADARRHPVRTEPRSVRSGKTIHEIANE